MKVLYFGLAALLLASGTQALLCPNATETIGAFSDLSDIASLIDGFNMLPEGIPENATIFLPDNEGVAALLGQLQAFLPGVTVDALPEKVKGMGALADTIINKLTSALLYHVATGGAWTPDELVEAGTIPTALGPDYTLTILPVNATGTLTVTDLTDSVADVLDDPVSLCGSEIYIVDKLLMPASLLAIPDTTPEEAIVKLYG